MTVKAYLISSAIAFAIVFSSRSGRAQGELLGGQPPATPKVTFVARGSNLQTAINVAGPGDILELEAGATFTGAFVIPEGTTNLTLRSSEWKSLPSGRVSADDADNMPRIVPSHVSRIPLTIEAGTSGIILDGLDIDSNETTGTVLQYGCLHIGSGSAETPADDILVKRCYIHGQPHPGKTVNGIVTYKTTNCTIRHCCIDEIHGDESHCIHVYTSPGPTYIDNNYLGMSSISVFIADSTIPDGSIAPDSVFITKNHIYKPLEWHPNHPSYNAATAWTVKNHIEAKGGSNIIIEGNLIENMWVSAQQGHSVSIVPFAADVTNFTVRYNVIKNVYTNFQATTTDGHSISGLVVENNLFVTDVAFLASGAESIVLAGVPGDTNTITVRHNTVMRHADLGELLFFHGSDSVPNQIDSFVFKDMISSRGSNAILGNNTGAGKIAIAHFCQDYDVDSILFHGDSFGDGNAWNNDTGYQDVIFEPTLGEIGFVNTAFTEIGHYALQESSPYHNTGSDGLDWGADITTLLTKMAPEDINKF